MYQEDDLIPISALQHLAFCERQCALIHIEQAWAENRLTAEGRVMHDRVHDAGAESRPGIRVVRGLRLHSFQLGLTGVADIVEFHADPAGVAVPGLLGSWRPFPIEYKRGRPKPNRCDEVQLCAQAVCLEEMLRTEISLGALFYGETRRRQTVSFDKELRAVLLNQASRAHALIEHGITPPAEYGRRCDSCSLLEICRPRSAGARKSARRYIGQMLSP